MNDNEKIIKKLIEYEAQKKETLDWPYHNLLSGIIDDIIQIVKEVTK